MKKKYLLRACFAFWLSVTFGEMRDGAKPMIRKNQKMQTLLQKADDFMASEEPCILVLHDGTRLPADAITGISVNTGEPIEGYVTFVFDGSAHEASFEKLADIIPRATVG